MSKNNYKKNTTLLLYFHIPPLSYLLNQTPTKQDV